MITDLTLANLFSAFAHPSRIAILRRLLEFGPTGQKFGELSSTLKIAPSTLTHHVHEMEAAGVLIREETGRTTLLRLNFNALNDAVHHLTALCCCAEDQSEPSE